MTPDDHSTAHQLWRLAAKIATGDEATVDATLAEFKEVLDAAPGIDVVNFADDAGTRALDVLARGKDSDQACYAILYLSEAGTQLDEQASLSNAPAVHSAAFAGNARILSTLLDLGAPADQAVNATQQRLLGGTPIHALASGYRGSRAQDYAECFAALLSAGCDVDAKDRKRQTAMDIVTRAAASTQERQLFEAMLNYGVKTNNPGLGSASAVANSMARRSGDMSLVARLSRSVLHANSRRVSDLESLDLPASDADTESLTEGESPQAQASGLRPL